MRARLSFVDSRKLRMTLKFIQPVTRRTVVVLLLSLCALTFFVGHLLPLVRARYLPDFDELWRGIFGSIILSWLALPCGFLFLVHRDSIMHDFPTAFCLAYWSVILLFIGLSVWLRRWPLLLVPAALLLV